MLYNRAAADPDGKPWSERKRLTWWDEAQARWQSYDSVDFEPDKRPDYRPDWRKKPVGMAALRGDEPFIMMPDGRGAIFSPSRSEEHTSELQSLMRISYAVFCLTKKH